MLAAALLDQRPAMTPLVSILIPAHNAEAYVAETIQSALDQTWLRKEIILVDDGSSDQTRLIAQRYASAQVKIAIQENQGAAAARNHAFRLCQGDFIQWLDADDLLAPDKIERQMAVYQASGDPRLLFSCAWGSFFWSTRRSQFRRSSLWCDLSPHEWLIRKLGDNAYMQTGVWLVSRELSAAAGPWDARLLSDDDGEYFSRVILASVGVRFVAEAKSYYRVPGPASLSFVGLSRRKLEALLVSMRLQIGYARAGGDSPRVRRACLQYLQTSLPCFYPECPDLVEQMHQLASELGGTLVPVSFNWKYCWLQKVWGWTAAKRAQIAYNRAKLRMLRSWDRTRLLMEGGVR